MLLPPPPAQMPLEEMSLVTGQQESGRGVGAEPWPATGSELRKDPSPYRAGTVLESQRDPR